MVLGENLLSLFQADASSRCCDAEFITFKVQPLPPAPLLCCFLRFSQGPGDL